MTNIHFALITFGTYVFMNLFRMMKYNPDMVLPALIFTIPLFFALQPTYMLLFRKSTRNKQ